MNTQRTTMITFSGVTFDYLHPIVDDIVWTDIAHALSLTCRFSGHTKSFYSVAQHSLNVIKKLEIQEQHASNYKLLAYALLHDASEAYMCDIPRNLKALIYNSYCPIEKDIMNCILTKAGVFNLTFDERKIVEHVDDRILVSEANRLFDTKRCWMLDVEPYIDLDVSLKKFEDVEREFLRSVDFFTKNIFAQQLKEEGIDVGI